MSIFDENRELTPEVFRQHKFREDESGNWMIGPIVNKNTVLVIYLYFMKSNHGYRVTGDAGDHRFNRFNVFKLKEKYIDDAIDFETFMHCIREINFINLFDYFELSV